VKSGMSRETGKLITGLEYLKQRLGDVINTELGSLVGARGFGSRVPELVDRNVDSSFRMNAYIRLAEALANSENGLDDFKLSEMSFSNNEENQTEILLVGDWLYSDDPVEIDGIVLDGRN
jgi:phage baseplate assembly protein W